MRHMKTLASAAALVAGLAISASASAAIFVGISTDGGATINTIASGSNTAGVLNFSAGNFTINNISAVGVIPPLDLLSSNSLNTSSTAGGTLDVYILETNIPASTTFGGFISSLTSNTLPTGWSVTESTFFSAANSGNFGAGVLLASHTFSNIGTSVIGSPANPSAQFALTEQYHISATGSGSANSTIDIASVPEPATWGMMFMGFGGIGAMVRSSRRRHAVATA
jgi:hypothetical protein